LAIICAKVVKENEKSLTFQEPDLAGAIGVLLVKVEGLPDEAGGPPGPVRRAARTERVLHLVRLEHRKSEQLIGEGGRSRLVLLGRQRREAVSRLRSDHDARPAARDHIAEFFEHERGAVQIDLQDRGRRCLRRREAGPPARRASLR
jgi:hypothetical protein